MHQSTRTIYCHYFIKRPSDVFDGKIKDFALDIGDRKWAEDLIDKDHSLVKFYLPKEAQWSKTVKQTTKIGEYLTDVVRKIARENQKLQGVIV